MENAFSFLKHSNFCLDVFSYLGKCLQNLSYINYITYKYKNIISKFITS